MLHMSSAVLHLNLCRTLKTFYVMGGIDASDISSVVFLIDGTLLFSNDLSSW